MEAALAQIVNNQLQHHNAQETTAARQARDRRELREEENIFQQEKARVGSCDGSTTASVREWLRELAATVDYFAAGRVDRNLHRLMASTSRGNLRAEYDTFMASHLQRNLVSYRAAATHIAQAFLGTDESAALRDQLRQQRQSAREEIPEYNRRFKRDADYAYPNAQRTPDQEQELADIYMGGLRGGTVKDACFDADPQLATLAAAMAHADQVHGRRRRRDRVTRATTVRQEEAMEVCATDNPIREQLQQIVSTIAKLQHNMTDIAAKQNALLPQRDNNRAPKDTRQGRDNPRQGQQNARKTDSRPQRNRTASASDRCYECSSTGHFGRDCPVRRARLAHLAHAQSGN